MKIQIASDLHLEGRAGHMPSGSAFRTVPGRDVLVLAGDIGNATQARSFVLGELDASPVIYVPGNHEYYSGRCREDIDAAWKALADEHTGLQYLTAETLELDGIRFWGGPWYSDLWGVTTHDAVGVGYRRQVEWSVADFHARWGGATWSIDRHINHHLVQTDLLAACAGKVDVVITHWPPTKEAIHPKFDGDALNPYFINDKADLVREIGAALWISGHTHEAYDYQIGATRCLGNPTGYSGEDRQSRLFRPDKVVRV